MLEPPKYSPPPPADLGFVTVRGDPLWARVLPWAAVGLLGLLAWKFGRYAFGAGWGEPLFFDRGTPAAWEMNPDDDCG